MIVGRIMNAFSPAPNMASLPPGASPIMVEGLLPQVTKSGQVVTPETAKGISTAYRCGNIISDDIAKIPLQMFTRQGNAIRQIGADPVTRNMAYLLQVSPNRYMTPFIFKKTLINWLLYWGNALAWQPAGSFRELYILPANLTYPTFDRQGDLWYVTILPDGKHQAIPSVEVLHLMINSSNGYWGKSVLQYARESMGRQLGAYETQDLISSQGLNAAGIIWVNGELSKEARDKMRGQYESVMNGSENSGRLAIFDNKIEKFEQVTMKASDMQFLEGIAATDAEIANFFGMPLHKLNQGKQSYQSNEQQQLDYLSTTLDPYLVQWEEGARLKWLSEKEQKTIYFKFIRESILRMDAKSRAELHEIKIRSGQETPNEARETDDMSGYADGDRHYMASNYTEIGAVNVPA